MNEFAVFKDIAVLLTVAGLAAALFVRLGLPKVIGYLCAGILLNRYTWGGAFLLNEDSVHMIGQMGIVILMFTMGLSFSKRDLQRVKGVAIPCAILDTVVMIWLGYTLGVRVFGWSNVASFFLGIALCDSATTLLVKMMDELNWRSRPFCAYVLGTSVCEDIICVGAITLALGLAGSGAMSLTALCLSMGKLLVFFLAVLVLGFVLVPRLLDSIGHRNDDESLLLVVLAICCAVSFLAYALDLSLALGAFLVGLIAACSDMHGRITRLTDPLKALYGSIFFVSIGLYVDPAAFFHHLGAILFLSAVVIGGKLLNNFLGSVLAGLDIRTAVQNGLGLAQIGEFGFMVALVYLSLNPDSTEPMFPIAVGVTLLTTLLNPLLLRYMDRCADFVAAQTPTHLQALLETYGRWVEKLSRSKGNPAFQVLKRAVTWLGVYAALMFAFSTVSGILYRFDYTRFSVFFEDHDRLFFFILANLLSISLLPLVFSSTHVLGKALGDVLLGTGEARWIQPVRNFVRFVTLIAVAVLFFAEWTMLNISLAPRKDGAMWIATVVIVLAAVFGWRFFVKSGRRAGKRLRAALSAEERQEKLAQLIAVQETPSDDERRLIIPEGSPAIGGTVVSLNIRAQTGASVIGVIRQGQIRRNVGPSFVFQAGDTLLVLADPDQLSALHNLLH